MVSLVITVQKITLNTLYILMKLNGNHTSRINNTLHSFINCIQLTIDQIICFIRRINGVIIHLINKCVHVVNIRRNAAGGVKCVKQNSCSAFVKTKYTKAAACIARIYRVK